MTKQHLTGWTVMAIASIPMIMTLGNSMLIPILPQMRSALDLTQFEVSLTISVFSIAGAVFIPVFGYLSDHFSRKAVIIPALILYALGGLLAGIAPLLFAGKAYTLILGGRIMQGIGAAGTTPIAMALTGDLFKGAQESKVLGLIEASNAFGKVISPILGAVLALIFWYAVFFAYPLFSLFSLVLTWIFVKEQANRAAALPFGQYLKGLLTVFKHEGRWLFSTYLAGAVCLFTLFGILFYLSDVLEKTYEVNGVLKGSVLAIPLLVMLTTAYLTGSLIKENQQLMKSLIVTGLMLMTVSFALLVFFTNLYLFMGILLLSSVGTGMVLPCLNRFITGAVGKARRGFVTSLYGSVRFLGVALGPPVFGWLMAWSRTGMFLGTAGLTLLTALLILFTVRVAKKETAEEPRSTLFKKIQPVE
ncbi:putative MFS-type transporter YitG [Caldalkalibacillus thermarum]|nr:putative MFS-type transporter YitG [Caldalkalibacillus thermarum]